MMKFSPNFEQFWFVLFWMLLLKLFRVGCDPDEELLDCRRVLKLTNDADALFDDESPLDVDIAELM